MKQGNYLESRLIKVNVNLNGYTAPYLIEADDP